MNNHHVAIKKAIDYLENRGMPVPVEVLQSLSGKGIITLSPKEEGIIIQEIKSGKLHSRALKQIGSYQGIRDELWSAVFDASFDFLNSSSQVTTYSRPMAAAVSKAYIESLDTGYVDGGGSLPIDQDTADWARSELGAQLSYVDSLFGTLKQLRKEGDVDSMHEAYLIAQRWASALDGFYNAAKMAGAGNKMLTWNIGSTEKHCNTCLKLDGQRHRASWFSAKGYFPRKPGSATDCGGYHCDCSLSTDDGESFSI